MESNLRVLIADEDESTLEGLRVTLEALGHEVIPFAVSVREAAELIAREDPNLTIVMVHQDDEHALSLIAEAVEYASGPVIATVRDGDADFLARAAEHGISAYVEGTAPQSVQGAIEVSLRRYRETEKLAGKVDQLEGALERRVIIERAKGILMERHGADERRAFELLRENARSQQPARGRRRADRRRRPLAAAQGRRRALRPMLGKLADPRPGPRLELSDFKRAFQRFQKDQMGDHAAALTYYSLLSLFPALLFGVAALGFFGGQALINDAADYLLKAGAPRETVDAVIDGARVGAVAAQHRGDGPDRRAGDLALRRVGRVRRGRARAQRGLAGRGGAQLHPQEAARRRVDAVAARARADHVRADLRRRRGRAGPARDDRARRRRPPTSG